ncbi:MAG: hypothetical protein ACODAU_12890 [Myxococcota bacterium]
MVPVPDPNCDQRPAGWSSGAAPRPLLRKARGPEGLQAVAGARWGEVTLHIEHDGEAGIDVIDDELVEWCLAHGLGTPSQRTRWESRATDLAG